MSSTTLRLVEGGTRLVLGSDTAEAARQVALAAAQVGLAQDQAAIATAQANNAALSAAGAMVLSNLYPDTASGVAAVAEGAYFGVAGTGDAFATLYRKTGGVAVAGEVYPSRNALQRPMVNVALYGASPSATAAENLTAFETAAALVELLGGGTIYVPPAAAAYDIAVKLWADAGDLRACIRLPAKVELYIPAGATIRMAPNQISGSQAASVVLLYGADTAVTGTGVIDGGSLQQASYSTYAQNGPNGVFIPAAAQCHRARIGAGAHGYLTIQNCFGNPINGGGSLVNGLVKDVTIAGVKSDNVGEGPQLERADRVEMRRVVSLNTTGNMTGDGAELAGVTNFLVEDVYAEGTAGSGFDLFGCQKGTVRHVTCINCNFDVHDFAPVDPCEDVLCEDINVTFNTGGSGGSGITMESSHATKAPKNIKIRNSRVVNTAALNNGVNVTQSQDVATYGGGPYDLDIDVQGTTVSGYSIGRAPRLKARGRVRSIGQYGFTAEVSGFPATDNVDWDIALDIVGSGVKDFRINGTVSPQGKLGGNFTTYEGTATTGLVFNERLPNIVSIDTTTVNSIKIFGERTLVSTGAGGIISNIQGAADGTRLTIYAPVGVKIYNNFPSGDYRGILSKAGPNITPADGIFDVPAKGRVELLFSAASNAWLEI